MQNDKYFKAVQKQSLARKIAQERENSARLWLQAEKCDIILVNGYEIETGGLYRHSYDKLNFLRSQLKDIDNETTLPAQNKQNHN